MTRHRSDRADQIVAFVEDYGAIDHEHPLLVALRHGVKRRGPVSIAKIRYELETGRIAPEPIEYQGYHMRSMLEARFAFHLDRRGETWVYEPRVYGPRGRRYLPDFQITSSLRPTFIEIKPRLEDVEAAEAKMEVIWDDVPDALLMVAVWEHQLWYARLRDEDEWSVFKEDWAA